MRKYPLVNSRADARSCRPEGPSEEGALAVAVRALVRFAPVLLAGMERRVAPMVEPDATRCALASCPHGYAGGDDPFVDVFGLTTTSADGDPAATFVNIVRLAGVSSLDTESFSLRTGADGEACLEARSATFTPRSGGTAVELGS